MKYQLVFSRQRNERNNYERANPSENMLLLKEASGPRSSLDLWRPLKKKKKKERKERKKEESKHTGKQMHFFIQHLGRPICKEKKSFIYVRVCVTLNKNLFFTLSYKV